MSNSTVLTLFLTAALLATLGYIFHDRKIHAAGDNYPIARSFPLGTPVLHVYFIGDSYTYVNELPRIVEAVAASDTVSPVDVETGMFAQGNSTLDDLWKYHDPHRDLHSQHWDYVVLQEHSMQTLRPEWVQIMHAAMTRWNEEIRDIGAKPVVYETWARKPGSAWYDAKKYPGAGFGDPVYMQDQIDKVTNDYAAEISASIGVTSRNGI